MRSVCRHSACSTRWPAWPLVAGAVALVKDREIRPTILLHLIPGVIETSIRLPPGHPFAESPESPVLRPILLGLTAAWIIGLVLQLRWLRGQGAVVAVPATPR